ncbi:MAG: histidinol phosphatase [Bifidobacteriaceae bacterium]|jgi:histidinol-phosphatase|nr:histidinol phosphatase [Bifidobacteriaceae bacterium]
MAKDSGGGAKASKKATARLEAIAAAQARPVEPGTYLEDLRLALSLADQIDEITLSRFGAPDLTVEAKEDSTPVSDADRRAEAFAREQLERARPADKVLGEEFGGTKKSKLLAIQEAGTRAWVIDPIDGTANYVRGLPVWATLIGLVADGRPAVGVVSAPALGRRWFAAAGYGAWRGYGLDNAQRIKVSKVKKLGEAFLSYSSLADWEDQGRLPGLLRLAGDVDRTRAFGDFWSYMLLAEGSVDIAAEPELAPHDMVAVAAVVAEAGGLFTDTKGKVVGPFGDDGLATNGRLHERVVSYLRKKSAKD